MPFAVWSVLYYALRLFGTLITHAPAPELSWSTIWTGTTHHLWFLPFIFTTSVLGYAITQYLKPTNNWQSTLFVVLLTIGAIIISVVKQSNTLPLDYALDLWINATPAALIGLAMGRLPSSLSLNTAAARTTLVILTALLLILLALGHNHLLIQNLAGIAVFLTSLTPRYNNRKQFLQLLSYLGSLTFGVYIVHVAFIEGFQDLLKLFTNQNDLVIDTTVFCIATTLSFLAISIGSYIMPRSAAKALGLV